MVSTTSIRMLTAGAAAGGGGGATGGASYQTLYLKALGADPQQVGLLTSTGSVANAMVALPMGWISDRFSLRKVVIFGLVLSIIVPGLFTVATTWSQAIPAMMINRIMGVLLGMFTNVFYVTSVKLASDRATAMSMKSILTSLVGLAFPMISALVVTNFGGIGLDGIRPLFTMSIVGSILVFIFAFFKLKEVSFLQKKGGQAKKKSILQDYKEIAKIPAAQKWTIAKVFRSIFGQGLLAFYSLYYVETKGADPFIIGAMGTAATLGALLLLGPFGRLADKHGRKKIIYITRPVYYGSLSLAIFAPSPEWLIIAAFLGSFQTVSFLMEITMEHELVPPEQRGRWGGFLFFFVAFAGIIGPNLAGFLWERVNQSLLLMMPIITDIPMIAILPGITDTLHAEYLQKAEP